jgi:Domain of unknown function (DUF4124)
MKTTATLLSVLLFAALSASAAQLYRWVDGKGNVEWRDTPPPAAAKKVEQRKIGDNVISTGEAPFSVQLATKNHPVTLWVAPDCKDPCSIARTHLNRRGTPYTERSVSDDFEGFKKLSPQMEVPFLQVGAIRVKGYLESEYDSTLDAAGYPRTAVATKPKPAAPAPQAKPPADAAAAPGAPAAK